MFFFYAFVFGLSVVLLCSSRQHFQFRTKCSSRDEACLCLTSPLRISVAGFAPFSVAILYSSSPARRSFDLRHCLWSEMMMNTDNRQTFFKKNLTRAISLIFFLFNQSAETMAGSRPSETVPNWKIFHPGCLALNCSSLPKAQFQDSVKWTVSLCHLVPTAPVALPGGEWSRRAIRS